MLIKQLWMHSCQHVQWYLSCHCSCRYSLLLVSFTPGNDLATSSQTHLEAPVQQGATALLCSTRHPAGAPQGGEVCVHPAKHSLGKADLLIPLKVERGEIYKTLREHRDLGSRPGSEESKEGCGHAQVRV